MAWLQAGGTHRPSADGHKVHFSAEAPGAVRIQDHAGHAPSENGHEASPRVQVGAWAAAHRPGVNSCWTAQTSASRALACFPPLPCPHDQLQMRCMPSVGLPDCGPCMQNGMGVSLQEWLPAGPALPPPPPHAKAASSSAASVTGTPRNSAFGQAPSRCRPLPLQLSSVCLHCPHLGFGGNTTSVRPPQLDVVHHSRAGPGSPCAALQPASLHSLWHQTCSRPGSHVSLRVVCRLASGPPTTAFHTPAYITPGTATPEHRPSSDAEVPAPSLGGALQLPKDEDRQLPLAKLFANLEVCASSVPCAAATGALHCPVERAPLHSMP